MTAEREGTVQTAPQADAGAVASLSTAEIHSVVLRALDDSKAEDIVSIDISRKSSLGDVMVVASGRSHRHVSAIADGLTRDLKAAKVGNLRSEGQPHCDWVLVDAGDVIVHVFRPEVRAFYNLEKMWSTDPVSEPARAFPRSP